MMQFQILSGSDRFANMVQWFFMLNCVNLSTLFVNDLGYSLKEQILSALVCLSIPLLIAQATTTQNDVVVSFWIFATVYFVFLSIRKSKIYLFLLVGFSSGIAILTKGNAYVILLPFLLFWAIMLGRKKISNFKYVVLAGLMAILLNYGHYTRNYALFKNPIGVSNENTGHIYITHFSGKIFVSNIIRALACELIPPIPDANIIIHKTVDKLHQFMGIKVNDPKFTEQDFLLSKGQVVHQDSVPNFVHSLLFGLAVLVFVFKKQIRQKVHFQFLILIVFAFVFFVNIIVVRHAKERQCI